MFGEIKRLVQYIDPDGAPWWYHNLLNPMIMTWKRLLHEKTNWWRLRALVAAKWTYQGQRSVRTHKGVGQCVELNVSITEAQFKE